MIHPSKNNHSSPPDLSPTLCTWIECTLAIRVWYKGAESAVAHVTMHQPLAGAADVVATLVDGGTRRQLFLQPSSQEATAVTQSCALMRSLKPLTHRLSPRIRMTQPGPRQAMYTYADMHTSMYYWFQRSPVLSSCVHNQPHMAGCNLKCLTHPPTQKSQTCGSALQVPSEPAT